MSPLPRVVGVILEVRILGRGTGARSGTVIVGCFPLLRLRKRNFFRVISLKGLRDKKVIKHRGLFKSSVLFGASAFADPHDAEGILSAHERFNSNSCFLWRREHPDPWWCNATSLKNKPGIFDPMFIE